MSMRVKRQRPRVSPDAANPLQDADPQHAPLSDHGRLSIPPAPAEPPGATHILSAPSFGYHLSDISIFPPDSAAPPDAASAPFNQQPDVRIQPGHPWWLGAALPTSLPVQRVKTKVPETPVDLQSGPNPGGPVIVLVHYSNGHGDIIFGYKLAAHLKAKFNVATMLVTDNAEVAKQYAPAYQLVQFKTPQECKRAGIEPALVIEGPVSKSMTAAEVNSLLGCEKVPVINIAEYGHRSERLLKEEGGKIALSSGLGPESLGVMVDPHLAKESEDISQNLALGVKFGFVPSDRGVDVLPHLWPETDRPEWVKAMMNVFHGALYHGYQTYAPFRERFIYTALAKESGKTRDVNIAISVDSIAKLQEPVLRHYGISKVTVYDAKSDEEVTYQQVMDSGQSGKTLRILNLGKIPRQDFLKVMQAADPLWGSTGDQSWSEAASVGKVQQYELLGHKREFFDQYVALARQVDPEGTGLVRFISLSQELIGERTHEELQRLIQEVGSAGNYYLKGDQGPTKLIETLDKLGTLLRDPTVEEQSKQLASLLLGDYSLFETVDLWLGTSLTELAKAQKARGSEPRAPKVGGTVPVTSVPVAQAQPMTVMKLEVKKKDKRVALYDPASKTERSAWTSDTGAAKVQILPEDWEPRYMKSSLDWFEIKVLSGDREGQKWLAKPDEILSYLDAVR